MNDTPRHPHDLLALKTFDARLMAKDPDRQTAHIHIPIAVVNRLSALGRANIARVA